MAKKKTGKLKKRYKALKADRKRLEERNLRNAILAKSNSISKPKLYAVRISCVCRRLTNLVVVLRPCESP